MALISLISVAGSPEPAWLQCDSEAEPAMRLRNRAFILNQDPIFAGTVGSVIPQLIAKWRLMFRDDRE